MAEQAVVLLLLGAVPVAAAVGRDIDGAADRHCCCSFDGGFVDGSGKRAVANVIVRAVRAS